MRKSALTLGLCVVTLSGCVSQSTWAPTVDTFGNSRAQFVNQDTQECRSLANQSSGSTAGNATRGAVGGGLLGAASHLGALDL
jgi:outer membrane lipoprotein SlyB